ncbi:G-type lectin S-receptor-like serine/threonine-protein kinase SD1-1, partial [Camellia lanceoleosa]
MKVGVWVFLGAGSVSSWLEMSLLGFERSKEDDEVLPTCFICVRVFFWSWRVCLMVRVCVGSVAEASLFGCYSDAASLLLRERMIGGPFVGVPKWSWFSLLRRRCNNSRRSCHVRRLFWPLPLVWDTKKGSNKKNKRTTAITSIIVISGVLVLSLIGWYFLKELHKRRAWRLDNRNQKVQDNNQRIVEDENLALLLFDLATVSSATNNFSLTNKIGEGGFGPVYRGELTTGGEIAVKRLSKTSRQGLSEFKNEVILISKLQHRNLVRLLGCCIHEEERMLIYEYMPNKSLDTFIFNQTRGTSLDWKKRFDIIVGIARGLLYLHRDSRLRVIHRDLKAGNILLDSEMNPKIADFGLARSFGGDQFEENTNRVIGTYGYMSPEYAINGHFSVKSDVFSFGVIVLEIVSGKKNRGFYDHDHGLSLLGH